MHLPAATDAATSCSDSVPCPVPQQGAPALRAPLNEGPNVPPALVHTLAKGAWIRAGQPVCLIGDSGTGKSHLLIGRFIVTDTLGLLLTVVVVTAAVQDRDGAKPALLQAYLCTRVRFVFTDGAFAGRLLDWADTILRTTLHIVRNPADQRGFVVIPPVGRRAHLRLAHRAPPPGPRLRTRPRDLRGLDPLGRDQHHPAGSPAEGPPPGSNDAPSPPPVDRLEPALSPEREDYLRTQIAHR